MFKSYFYIHYFFLLSKFIFVVKSSYFFEWRKKWLFCFKKSGCNFNFDIFWL